MVLGLSTARVGIRCCGQAAQLRRAGRGHTQPRVECGLVRQFHERGVRARKRKIQAEGRAEVLHRVTAMSDGGDVHKALSMDQGKR